ncbi:hypothetical protein, partial [Escherichia coli]|uniref:hypothetical protein n=1 Tax=Escherichia coli TaxID=562 RepID=UPI001BDD4BE3
GWAILLWQKQKKLIMLPSEIMIWQPEFTDKTLSRKPGAVHSVVNSPFRRRNILLRLYIILAVNNMATKDHVVYSIPLLQKNPRQYSTE